MISVGNTTRVHRAVRRACFCVCTTRKNVLIFCVLLTDCFLSTPFSSSRLTTVAPQLPGLLTRGCSMRGSMTRRYEPRRPSTMIVIRTVSSEPHRNRRPAPPITSISRGTIEASCSVQHASKETPLLGCALFALFVCRKLQR